jgi:Fe-S cluster assembly ATP-binding protein
VAEPATLLECRNLRIRRNQRTVLQDFNLRLAAGGVAVLHVLGRDSPTRIAEALTGAARVRVESGCLLVAGDEVGGLDPLQRARRGMILVDPHRAVSGVTVSNHVRIAQREQGEDLGTPELRKRLLEALDCLGLDSHFAGRMLPEQPPLPDGLRLVLLTLSVLRPRVAVFPVGDTDVDLDAVRLLVTGLTRIERAATALVILTTDARLARELPADQKWELQQGTIVGPLSPAH